MPDALCALPDSIDLAIIGAGSHALTLVTHLLQKKNREDFAILHNAVMPPHGYRDREPHDDNQDVRNGLFNGSHRTRNEAIRVIALSTSIVLLFVGNQWKKSDRPNPQLICLLYLIQQQIQCVAVATGHRRDLFPLPLSFHRKQRIDQQRKIKSSTRKTFSRNIRRKVSVRGSDIS